ncbi:MAG: STAS domain-containing protein [Burkholderiaceae bacterium]
MLALPETLTLAEAKAAVSSIEQALGDVRVDAADGADAAGTAPFVVDASALRSFDTSAIAVLIEARRLAQAAGRGLAVRGVPASMQALAEIYGVDGLLGLPGPGPGDEAAPAAAVQSSLT